MKRIAAILLLSFLLGSAWAESKTPVKPPPPKTQVPFSFLPAKNSIFTDTEIKPIQVIQEPQTFNKNAVLELQLPLAPSHVDGINPAQAKGLAMEIARFLATQQPADSTTIQLQASNNRTLKAFNTFLELALREQGFAISKEALPGALQISYQITRNNREILMRLLINQTEATRLYGDDLKALTPWTLLNKGGQP